MKHRQLQTVQNIFILNLCLSNVLMCLTSLPITFITNVYKQWFFSSPICKLIPLVQGASIFVSSFSLSAIALDRYNLVVRPHKQKLSTRSAMMIALLIWVISVVVCMPYGWYMDVDKIGGLCGEYCTEHWPLAEVRKGYAFLVLITQFLFPFATMAFCYYNIFFKVETKNCPESELSCIRTVPNQNCPEAELFVSELSRIRTVRIRTAPNQNYPV
uniref:G_PROTEIN_RECEP_F1_2 domain-containing protein n=2 Tax=Caenorhabditis japonica TaxID=281687 RepID=A0A8R1HP41_CAEJA